MNGGIGEAALINATLDTAGLTAAEAVAADAAAIAAANIAATTTATAAGTTAAGTTAAGATAAGAFDPLAFEGIGQYMAQAPVNPVTQAFNAGNAANLTGNAPNAFQGITELNASQTADLMRNIDPRMINAYQPYFNPNAPFVEASFVETPSFLEANQVTGPSFLDQASAFATEYKNPLTIAGTSLGLKALMDVDSRRYGVPPAEKYNGPLSKFSYNPSNYRPDIVKPPTPYRPQYAGGGPVEMMSNNAAMGANTMYPMANMSTSSFATPYQTPQSTNMLANMAPSGGGAVNAMSGEPSMQGTRMAEGGIARLASGGFFKNVLGDAAQLVGDAGMGAVNLVGNIGEGRLSLAKPDHGSGYQEDYSKNSYTYDPNKYKTYTAPTPDTYQTKYADGGIASLGSYSDGGRMLKGPGDGMSDSIPARIGAKQEARLADGEFVVPADVVSHLGNGSTDAGAKKLYSMMDKVRQARTGRKAQGRQIKPNKYMPA